MTVEEKLAPDLEPTNAVGDTITVDGEVVAYTGEHDFRYLAGAIRRMPAQAWNRGGSRISGISNDNATFGWMPPAVIRGREGCSPSRANTIAPDALLAVLAAAKDLADLWAEHDPDGFSEAMATAHDAIDEGYFFEGSPWTSAIINDTAVLPYHTDQGNLAGVGSGMAIVRRFSRGGHLHLPDYDTVVNCANNSYILFNGRDVNHGVTPIRHRKKDAWRYSVVFYCRAGMGDCLDPVAEIERTNRLRSEREHRMAERD